MRMIIFAGIFALSASTSLAQTGTAPAPADPAAAQQAGAGGPANLCQELVAFMNAPPPEAPAAPAKPAPASTPKESVMSVTDAQALADTNDIAACQGAAKELRIAGVAMPPPLLALAALDLQYHQSGAASPQAPQTQEPAAQPQ